MYQLSATSHRSITAFPVKMHLTFLCHGIAVSSQFLCHRVQCDNTMQLWCSINGPLDTHSVLQQIYDKWGRLLFFLLKNHWQNMLGSGFIVFDCSELQVLKKKKSCNITVWLSDVICIIAAFNLVLYKMHSTCSTSLYGSYSCIQHYRCQNVMWNYDV